MNRYRRHPGLCDMCANIVLEDREVLSDGRIVCRTCHRTGLTTMAHVDAVRRKILDVFRGFGMVLSRPAPMKVVDAAEMGRHAGRAWVPSMNYDARPMGAYGLARDAEILLIESGQPPALLTWTLAHELAHDWHAEHNPAFPLLDEEIQEGFAQWAADEVARRLGYHQMAARQLHRPDVYGLAPRRFFRLESIGGIAEVLAFARQVGVGRAMRLGYYVARGEKQKIELDLRLPYGGWRRAVDLSLDGERLARQGYVFAATVCYEMALRSLPHHPRLWFQWVGRHLRNVVLLLSFRAGRARMAAVGWSILALLAVLIYVVVR